VQDGTKPGLGGKWENRGGGGKGYFTRSNARIKVGAGKKRRFSPKFQDVEVASERTGPRWQKKRGPRKANDSAVKTVLPRRKVGTKGRGAKST